MASRGVVSLSCTAASGLTCSIPSSESLARGGSASAALKVSVASSTAGGIYDVRITAKDPTGKVVHSLGIQAQVSASATFKLSNSGAVTLVHSAPTGNTTTISVKPSGGFTGTVDLSLCRHQRSGERFQSLDL